MRLTHGRHRTRPTTRRLASTRPPAHPVHGPHRRTHSPLRRRAHGCGASPCTQTTPARRAPDATSRPRRSRLLLVLWLAAAGVLLSGSVAHAETVHIVALAATVDQVLTNIRNWIMGILAAVAVVFLTIGGLRYLMASGDPGEIEKAKGSFKAAGIGFGLAALAPLVVEILTGIVGGV
jgi:hypothetical protein